MPPFRKFFFICVGTLTLAFLVLFAIGVIFFIELQYQLNIADPPIEADGHRWIMLRPYGTWSFPSGMMGSNVEGFRIDPAITVERSGNKTCIAILGGSVVWGHGVSRDQTMASHLEQALAEGRSNRFEVLNFGISGYTSSSELVLLAHKVIRYRPDHVVIFDGWNDFGARDYIPHYGPILRMYKTVLDQANYGVSSLRMSLNNVLFSTYSGRILSYLFNLSKGDEFIETARSAVAQDMERSILLPNGEWTHANYSNNLKAMAGILYEFGIASTFIFQPYNKAIFEQEKRDGEIYREFEHAFFGACVETNSACFSFLELFRTSKIEPETFLDIVHFTYFGNNVIGTTIAGLIEGRFQPTPRAKDSRLTRASLCQKPQKNGKEIPYVVVSHETC